MKIALVHDFLTRFGGAERVLFALHKMFPEAPVYVLFFDEKTRGHFPNAEIRPSFLQKFPKFLRNRPKFLAPFCPTAAETFDFRDFDLVISSSSSFAKGAIVRPKTAHICYCHSPMRYANDCAGDYIEDLDGGFISKTAAKILLHYLRLWDFVSADRVDYFIANSNATAQRIKKYYKKEAKVIYPPVAVLKPELQTTKSPEEKFFLIISQFTPYKRIDIAIEAFNRLGLPLYIAGGGPDENRLRKLAGSNVKFLGWISEEEKQRHLENCEALIFPGEDDFGIVPVEAMARGKPVLALRAGGALETVIEGKTGIFFDESTPESLTGAVKKFQAENFDAKFIQNHALKFGEEIFARKFSEFIKTNLL